MIVPNPPALRLPLGGVKLTRSNRLNASTRSSTRDSPAIRTRLTAARSIDQKFGPRTVLRPAFPNGWLGLVGMTTQSLLNQLVIDCDPDAAYGSHVTFGR